MSSNGQIAFGLSKALKKGLCWQCGIRNIGRFFSACEKNVVLVAFGDGTEEK